MGPWTTQAIAGGVLGDLVLGERIALEGKRWLVELVSAEPTGDPVLDDCLLCVAEGKRRASAQTWISRWSGQKLYHAAAEQLCEQRIVRTDVESVMLCFSRKVYPEVDPKPEKAILERLRRVIFSDAAKVDARTSVLISLASATDLLTANFPKKELRARRQRIEAIRQGEAVGKAAKAVVDGIQAAIFTACIVPAIVATT